MIVYRVFPWDGRLMDDHRGGPLFVPRDSQGSTRHGIPDKDGLLYASTSAVSAIAERLKPFRGGSMSEEDLWFGDYRWALATIHADDTLDILDLTNPSVLVEKKITIASMMTKDRALSQRLARRLYDEGVSGFFWTSALEAVWTNASLFESRTKHHLKVPHPITYLTPKMPEMADAAKRIGVAFR